LARFHGPVLDQCGVLLATCLGCSARIAMTWKADGAGVNLSIAPPGPAHRARQADPGLDSLLTVLDCARAGMEQALGAHPADAKHVMQVRRGLLESLEAYAAALGKRNLPVPPRLRDELSLQRELVPRSGRAFVLGLQPRQRPSPPASEC
jgi:hypothetical protein